MKILQDYYLLVCWPLGLDFQERSQKYCQVVKRPCCYRAMNTWWRCSPILQSSIQSCMLQLAVWLGEFQQSIWVYGMYRERERVAERQYLLYWTFWELFVRWFKTLLKLCGKQFHLIWLTLIDDRRWKLQVVSAVFVCLFQKCKQERRPGWVDWVGLKWHGHTYVWWWTSAISVT